jgi:hypothetical protein
MHFIRTLAGLLICLLWPFACANAVPNEVQVHPFPNPIRYTHHNDDFTVRVRVPGGVWKDLYEYNVKVDLDKPSDASMVNFNFDGTVELAIQKNNGLFSKVAVRPASKGIKPVVKDGIAYVTLQRPENLSVEFDDDHLHNLHVFSHAIRKDMPATANLVSNDISTGQMPDLSQNIVFFGPGIHSGEFRLRSGSTVYIHGSAILKNPLILDGVENVKVVSDGLFDGVDMMTVRSSSTSRTARCDASIRRTSASAASAPSAQGNGRTGWVISPASGYRSATVSSARRMTASPSTTTAGTSGAIPGMST